MFNLFKKPDRAMVTAATIVAKEFDTLLKEHATMESSKPWIEIWKPFTYSREIMEYVANVFSKSGWIVAYCNTARMIGDELDSGVMSWVISDNSSLVLLTPENYLEWEKSRIPFTYKVLTPKLFFKTDVKVTSPSEYNELKTITA